MKPLFLLSLALLLTGCANPTLREADTLQRSGDHEAALRLLTEASRREPQDLALRSELARQRERALLVLAGQAETARALNQLDLLDALLQRMRAVDAGAPRTRTLALALARARTHEARLREAQAQFQAGQLDAARAAVQQVLAEDPGQPQALALQQLLRQRYSPPPLPSSLAAAYQKPVSLEFRDAPLRTVFEAMGRGAGVNFVFDKEVRGDAKVTIFLKDVSLDEAMRVILATQQLERKLLNERSVLIYPATAAKQREHQELVTRTFYLNNADVKQAQALVRMMAKTRDVFIDERLNLLVARDTPEVIAMVEQLIAGLDLPEPEVMLDVEVLEVSTDRTAELGLQPATDAQYAQPNAPGLVPWSSRGNFLTLVANPIVTARLKGSAGASNTLANPKLRARNREKAKVQIGDKVPVFTSTSTANVGVSTAVTYLDVGIKLEVEPTVQLDNEVVMKVNLEVSTLGTKESSGGPQPATAYRIGSRNASTSLRLRDGETQVLAGLIKAEDGKGISGVPYLSEIPLLGRLFGVHTDTRSKTEIVLLITPHVLRNLSLPDASRSILASGVDANPGAEGARIRPAAQVAVPMSGAAPATAAIATAGTAAAPMDALRLSATSEAVVGDMVSVTILNPTAYVAEGELAYDPSLFAPAQAGTAPNGRLRFKLGPRGGQGVFVLRALAAAAGQAAEFTLAGATGRDEQGSSLPLRSEGQARVAVEK
ncbi:secretin N-terminal domain-containing protein [Roseateles sp. P5_D6]